MNNHNFTLQEWQICLQVLEKLKDNPLDNPDNQRFSGLITKIHKNAKKQLKQAATTERKATDLATVKSATIAQNALANTTLYSEGAKEATHFTKLATPRNCYSCNTSYQQAHSFYHKLCPTCAEDHYNRRFLNIDLTNRKVILTGGRVKIGYATALKLLRNHAELTITTRFPALTLAEFQQEKDFEKWKDRLDIYGLDLRNLKAVEKFIEYYQSKHNALDILINNAAQTIKYPENYYLPLMQKEAQLLIENAHHTQVIANETPVLDSPKLLNLTAINPDFPTNRFGNPIDDRAKNSWNSTLEEISLFELLEVNLINHIAPYLLIKNLTPLLKKSPFSERFIINVTSSEGQFSYSNKTIFHPHTNMTKAALNMMTRTSAAAYAKDHIYMTSVDVGWVSTGAQEDLRKRQFDNGYIPPLDSVDGAARIFQPIIEKLENDVSFVGRLVKNYQVVDW